MGAVYSSGQVEKINVPQRMKNKFYFIYLQLFFWLVMALKIYFPYHSGLTSTLAHICNGKG
jgi:hypothetical protein